jgi:hypothetical protein
VGFTAHAFFVNGSFVKNVFAYAFVTLLTACAASQEGGIGAKQRGTSLDVDIQANVIVADAQAATLRLLASDLHVKGEVGGPGWQSGEFDRPAGIWARNGIDVFVADYGNHRIQRFDRNLNFISSFSTRESAVAEERFGYPTDVALSRLGDLFICDSENSRIVKVTRFNRVERTFGGFDAGRGRLSNPTRIEVGPQDRVYVLDNTRIAVFDNFGNHIADLTGEAGFNPVDLYADQDGVVVLEPDKLHFFDREDRFLGVESLTRFMDSPDDTAVSLALARGSVYLLTDTGITVHRDPREALFEELLDKAGKNR